MATLQRTVKSDTVSPFIDHAIAIQGDKAQITSFGHVLVNWRSPSLLKITKVLGRGPLITPESLPTYRATASSEIAVGSETQSPPKAMGTTLPPLCNREPLHTKHSWFGDHYHPEGAPRCPPIVPLQPLQNGSRISKTTAHSQTNGQSQRTRCAHSHSIALVLPRFYPRFTPLSPCDGVKAG